MIDQRGVAEALAPPLRVMQKLVLQELGQHYPLTSIALEPILGIKRQNIDRALKGLRGKGLARKKDGGWLLETWTPTEPHAQPRSWDDEVAEMLK